MWEDQTDGCLPGQNGIARNPQLRRWCVGTGPPSPQPATHWPVTPPVEPGDSQRNLFTEMEGDPPGYVYIHTPLHNAKMFNLNAYAKVRMLDKEIIPDLLTNQGPCTDYYAVCCIVMQQGSIVQTNAASWDNQPVKTRINLSEQNFSVLSLSTISGHFKVYYNRCLCIIKEQSSDKEEGTWRG